MTFKMRENSINEAMFEVQKWHYLVFILFPPLPLSGIFNSDLQSKQHQFWFHSI